MILLRCLLIPVSESVKTLVKHQEDQQRQNIMEWLSSIDFATQHNDFRNRCQEGTGQWLLDSPQYITWVKNTKQTLFCPGIPGAGKTMLSSIVIKDLQSKDWSNNNFGVAFLYCSYNRQQEQRYENLVASLLRQLAQSQSSLPNEVRNLYNSHHIRNTRPSITELLSVLSSVVDSFSKVFIVVDALDECANAERKHLLRELFTLQARSQVNIFATSRFLPEIEAQFSKSMSLEIRAAEEDVRRYLENQILQLPSCVLRNTALQQQITSQIIDLIDGMYVVFNREHEEKQITLFIGSSLLNFTLTRYDTRQQSKPSKQHYNNCLKALKP